MKTRMLMLVMTPCLLLLGCGMEAEPTEEVRGQQVEPCQPEDCAGQGALIEDNCPPGTVLVETSECIDADGECVWDYSQVCVPIEEPPPPDDNPPPPPPSEGPPRPVRPPV